jgi:hypothetical protein
MAKSNKIVQPVIVVQDAPEHPLSISVSGPEVDQPEIKSVGYMRVSPTSNSWVSYVITTKGDKVLSIEVDEPNLRQIAEESAKINFVSTFSDQY